MAQRRVYVENTGEIQLSQPFGQWISRYGEDGRFQRYMEVGTSRGAGSTCCFYDGFVKRADTPVLQSYETIAERAAEAARHWSGESRVRIQHARLLQDWECPSWDAVKAVFANPTIPWHVEDIKRFWTCKYIEPADPQVVLLDGAECLTWFEFQKLWKEYPNVSVYLLDDTNMNKCARIKSFLEEQPNWVKIAGADNERNGWAIFERLV